MGMKKSCKKCSNRLVFKCKTPSTLERVDVKFGLFGTLRTALFQSGETCWAATPAGPPRCSHVYISNLYSVPFLTAYEKLSDQH